MTRKVLSFLIVVALLTPFAVCGMVFCPIQAAQAAKHSPCHEAAASDRPAERAPMFAVDCMGINFFKGDSDQSLKIPAVFFITFSFPSPESVSLSSRTISGSGVLREIKPDIPVSSASLFSETVRLLI